MTKSNSSKITQSATPKKSGGNTPKPKMSKSPKVKNDKTPKREEKSVQSDATSPKTVEKTMKRKHTVDTKSGPPAKQMRKEFTVYVNKLSPDTSAEDIKKHFGSEFGQVIDIDLPCKGKLTKSHFGFVSFSNEKSLKKAIASVKCEMDGRNLVIQERKPRVPATEVSFKFQVRVEGITQSTKMADVKKYFSKFGAVTSAKLVKFSSKKNARGYAFVRFDNAVGVEKTLNVNHHTIGDCKVDVKIYEYTRGTEQKEKKKKAAKKPAAVEEAMEDDDESDDEEGDEEAEDEEGEDEEMDDEEGGDEEADDEEEEEDDE